MGPNESGSEDDQVHMVTDGDKLRPYGFRPHHSFLLLLLSLKYQIASIVHIIFNRRNQIFRYRFQSQSYYYHQPHWMNLKIENTSGHGRGEKSRHSEPTILPPKQIDVGCLLLILRYLTFVGDKFSNTPQPLLAPLFRIYIGPHLWSNQCLPSCIVQFVVIKSVSACRSCYTNKSHPPIDRFSIFHL